MVASRSPHSGPLKKTKSLTAAPKLVTKILAVKGRQPGDVDKDPNKERAGHPVAVRRLLPLDLGGSRA